MSIATRPVTTPEDPVATSIPRRRPGWLRTTGWRHVIALAAVVFALFPILFIVFAALNPVGTLSSSSLVPTAVSLDNFGRLFDDPVRPYLHWYLNSMLIAGVGTIGSVFIGACSAYAFSRFRFRGRRTSLLFILLIQMFPALLAFIALYVTFIKISDVLPAIGLNTSAGLILVYLGGAMGANIWLLKGYFDTVPRELDEAAKMDGASHAQIFFGMILRLVAPVLVSVGLLSFIGLLNEFLLASIFLTDPSRKTLAVGLWAMYSADHNQYFGEFCAGALLASLPVVVLYLSLQRYIVSGLTSGSVKG
jgi:arabinogalactan oligomer/maltooligosaccharide transport system permease protein